MLIQFNEYPNTLVKCLALQAYALLCIICLRSDSTLVSFIVRHGIFAGEMDCVIERNILNFLLH